jgi:hypothetical protein
MFETCDLPFQLQQYTFINQDGTPANIPENVQLMVANQAAEGGENQTILVNSDGTLVQTGDQDMIVVIQSDDYDHDQSQGLIVVNPDQIQQVVGSDGEPLTLVETNDTMILSDNGDGANETDNIASKEASIEAEEEMEAQEPATETETKPLEQKVK